MAEALCNYLGILVQGKIAKIGSFEEIKEEFGDKMSMKIILKRETSERDGEIIKITTEETFPTARFVDHHIVNLITWF